MGKSPRLVAIGGAFALLASTIAMGVAAPAAQSEEYRLPATDFAPCTMTGQFYCIESVTLEMQGMPAKKAIWYAKGTTVPTTDDTSITPMPSTPQPTQATNYPGRWSFPGFPVDILGYDGVYVQSGPASTASDFAWIRMQPAAARADGTVGRAVVAEGATSPRDLDAGMKITAVMRFGPLMPTANVMVADGSIKNAVVAGSNTITFTGYPTSVPRAATSADCNGESGKALDKVMQMYAFVVFGNTRQSFGYDGMSGGLSVSTNGTCYITTPTYDPVSGTFAFTASAPHFAPDGTTVNRGFYIATIPLVDAALLFGITNPKEVKAALELTMENDAGMDVPVTFSVAARNGVITVAATNFQFSKPTFKLKVKKALWTKKYKKAAEAARKKASKG